MCISTLRDCSRQMSLVQVSPRCKPTCALDVRGLSGRTQSVWWQASQGTRMWFGDPTVTEGLSVQPGRRPSGPSGWLSSPERDYGDHYCYDQQCCYGKYHYQIRGHDVLLFALARFSEAPQQAQPTLDRWKWSDQSIATSKNPRNYYHMLRVDLGFEVHPQDQLVSSRSGYL